VCRVLASKAAATSVVPARVIGQKRIDQSLGLAHLDAKYGMVAAGRFVSEYLHEHRHTDSNPAPARKRDSSLADMYRIIEI
jgi:hypothetical protein